LANKNGPTNWQKIKSLVASLGVKEILSLLLYGGVCCVVWIFGGEVFWQGIAWYRIILAGSVLVALMLIWLTHHNLQQRTKPQHLHRESKRTLIIALWLFRLSPILLLVALQFWDWEVRYRASMGKETIGIVYDNLIESISLSNIKNFLTTNDRVGIDLKEYPYPISTEISLEKLENLKANRGLSSVIWIKAELGHLNIRAVGNSDVNWPGYEVTNVYASDTTTKTTALTEIYFLENLSVRACVKENYEAVIELAKWKSTPWDEWQSWTGSDHAAYLACLLRASYVSQRTIQKLETDKTGEILDEYWRENGG